MDYTDDILSRDDFMVSNDDEMGNTVDLDDVLPDEDLDDEENNLMTDEDDDDLDIPYHDDE